MRISIQRQQYKAMDDDEDTKPAAAPAEEGDGMDLLDDSMMSSQSQPHHQHHQSFTPLQSRRLPQPAYGAALCPSMDLIVLGLGSGVHGHGHGHHHPGINGGGHHHHHNGSSAPPRDYSYLDQNLSSGGGGPPAGVPVGSLAGMDAATATLLDQLRLASSPSVSVHRTVSWQKLLTLGSADLTSPPADEYDEKVADEEGEEGGSGGGGVGNDGGDGGGDKDDTDKGNLKDGDDEEDDDDIVLPFGGGGYSAKGGEDDDDNNNAAAAGSPPSADPNATAPKGCTVLCWSPDGRSFAIGLADGGVLVHDVERSMDGGVGGAVHSLQPGPARMAPPLPSPSPEGMSAASNLAAASAAASATGAGASVGLKTPAKPAKATTRSMTASRRLRSGRRGAGAGAAGGARGGQGGSSSGFSAVAGSDDNALPMPPVWKKGAITGLAWCRVGPPHPQWEITEAEEEREEAWRYRSHYLDRSGIFLPPCAYNPSLPNDENFPPSHPHHHGTNVAADEEEADEALLDRMARPTCRTPLSVLCVTTCANGTSFYLHGRYRILTVAPPAYAAVNAGARTVCSTDLGTFLTAFTALPPASTIVGAGVSGAVSASNLRTVLSLCSVPAIPQHRYELQTISSLHCSIMAHIHAIGKGLREATSSWNGALRQLDQKFDQVVNLLRNYGAITEIPTDASTTVKGNAVRLALRNYIISARSQRYASAASALDQFFGAPLMNDQLLQRMMRTLEASARSVEGQLRKDLLAPSRSLVWDSSELKGLVGAMSTTGLYGDQFMDPAVAYCLCQVAETLHLTIETCLRDMVDVRCRLRDVLGWIRSTASAVKAKDTAKDSALRENARKRRVDDSIVKKVAGYFAKDIVSRADRIDFSQRRISECVLGIPISDYFGASTNADRYLADQSAEQGISSIKDFLGEAASNVVKIFRQPRKTLMESVQRVDIEFKGWEKQNDHNDEAKKMKTVMSKPIAIHSRVGAGSPDQNDESATGCFRPRLDTARERLQSVVDQCRHWMVIAKVGEVSVRERTVIQIVVIPCAAFGSRSPFDDDCDAPDTLPAYYLESFVFLPLGCTVSGVEFYGDDGSRSPGTGVANTVAEGRQGLGILVERTESTNSSATAMAGGGQVSEELFLFSYDELVYRCVDRSQAVEKEKSKCLVIQEFNPSEDLHTSTPFTSSIGHDKDDGFHEDFGIERQYCKHRILKFYPKLFSNASAIAGDQASRFALSGSRGIGGIFSEPASSIDLFDLEEDEEEEEEEEGEIDE